MPLWCVVGEVSDIFQLLFAQFVHVLAARDGSFLDQFVAMLLELAPLLQVFQSVLSKVLKVSLQMLYMPLSF